jgi:hypothetical protein
MLKNESLILWWANVELCNVGALGIFRLGSRLLPSSLEKNCPLARLLYPLANGGANPTIVSYIATSSLVRFVRKNIFFYFEKRSSLLQRWSFSCKFRSRRIGSWIQTYDLWATTLRVAMCNMKIKILSSRRKNGLAYYNAGVVHSCKFRSRRIGSWYKSPKILYHT